MRRARTVSWTLLLVVLLVSPAGAESLWKRYTDYFDKLIERVGELDLYGVTAQLPQGIFKFKIDYNHRRAAGRFDSHRRRKPIVEPVMLGEAVNPSLVLDLGASGGGNGCTLQFSYGITDPLDFYFEMTFINMDVQLRPKLLKMDPMLMALINGYLPPGYPQLDSNWFDGGDVKERYLNEASDWFLKYLPRLGRPTLGGDGDYPDDLGPGKAYHSNNALADINLGFSWNFYRSPRWSGAFTGRVYFPTGNIADPNNSLVLGTGPKIDWGVGSFGLGFTQGYDLRLYKYSYWVDIVLSAEFAAAYRFKSHRRYPDFPKSTPDGNRLLDVVDPERSYFPDMSDLTGKAFEYTPGFGCSATLTLGIQFLLFDVGIGIGYMYAQEPELKADWRFETMVRSLEMQLAGHSEGMQIAAGFNLAPLYIPLSIHYKYEKAIGGRNMLFFDQNHYVTIEGVIPTVF